jgi:hypothetical protein
MDNKNINSIGRWVSLALVASLLLVAVATVCARESGTPTAVVTVDYLPVRQAPTFVTGTVAQLFRNQRVSLVGYRSADSAWVQVRLLGVETGWVNANAIETDFPIVNLAVVEDSSGNGRNSGAVAVVTADHLLVHEVLGPAATRIITQLARGERVELTGFRSANGRQVQVVLPDSQLGWVDADSIASDFPLFSLAVMEGL